MYKESFLMAWASIVANRMRSILTMLGIIIGVAAVITLVSIGNGVTKQVTDSISSLGSNLLIVMPGAPRTPGVKPSAGSQKSLKVADYEAIAKMDEVKEASPVTNGSYTVIYENQNTNTTVSGVDMSYQDINSLTMKDGHFFTQKQIDTRERVAIIGSTVAKNLYGTDNPIGTTIRVKNIPFTVIGVLESKGSSAMGADQDDVILIPYTTAMERVEGKDYLRTIYVAAKDGTNIDRLQADIENLLRVRHKIKDPNLDDFNITNMSSIMKTMQETTSTLTLFLGAVAAISLIVGGIGIMNIMLVSVTERGPQGSGGYLSGYRYPVSYRSCGHLPHGWYYRDYHWDSGGLWDFCCYKDADSYFHTDHYRFLCLFHGHWSYLWPLPSSKGG